MQESNSKSTSAGLKHQGSIPIASYPNDSGMHFSQMLFSKATQKKRAILSANSWNKCYYFKFFCFSFKVSQPVILNPDLNLNRTGNFLFTDKY